MTESRAPRHRKPIVVLDDLGERSIEHDGAHILLRPEVDAIHATYVIVKDDVPLDRLVLVIQAKIGKSSQFPNGVSPDTIEQALTYLEGLDKSDPQRIEIPVPDAELIPA